MSPVRFAAAARAISSSRPDVEGQHVVDREIRELMDEAVSDLAPRAGHQDHRSACHQDFPGPDR